MCCCACEDGAKRCPAGITDAFGQGVVVHQSADLQIFKIHRVVLLQQGECRLMVEVASLALYLLVRALEQGNCLAPTMAALRAPATPDAAPS
jgi:hypothetical protein